MNLAETKQQELERLEKELLEFEEASKENYGNPEPEKKDNIFRFFKFILGYDKSWKVGNLNNEEIGSTRLPVRSYLELGRYAKAEKLDLVEDYFIDRANIVAETTMGRKGFFVQMAQTNIKKEGKFKESEPKKRLFGGKKND